jgi:hypothetical protein
VIGRTRKKVHYVEIFVDDVTIYRTVVTSQSSVSAKSTQHVITLWKLYRVPLRNGHSLFN